MRNQSSELMYELMPEQENSDIITPESMGWQTIGRGAYLFSELVKRHGSESFTRHNWMPPHFEETPESAFAVKTNYLNYPLIATTYRIIEADYDGLKLGAPIEGHLFINALGYGFMLSNNFFKRTMRFYTFQFCMHDFQMVHMGKGLLKCSKCNFQKNM